MVFSSFYLDIRKTETAVPAPVKIRIYQDRKNIKHFATGYYLTEDQFYKLFPGQLTDRKKNELNNRKNTSIEKKSNKELKELKVELDAIKAKADNIIKGLGDNFTFTAFNRLFGRSKANNNNVITYYKEYSKQLRKNDQIGSADLYDLSLKSLLKFAGLDDASHLPFQTITVKFLNEYERWFVNSGKSETTVGMYLRCLRKIFKNAIADGGISADIYPFGQGKYQIPTGSNTKKAVEDDVLKAIYNADLSHDTSMQKGRDFWFFLYLCNGMNPKDMCALRFENIKDGYFEFRRQKTKRTIKKKGLPPIMVQVTPAVKSIMDKYCNNDRSPKNFVFPIYSEHMDATERMRVSKGFIRFVNDNMKRVIKHLGLSARARAMEARHSFTTKVTAAVGLEFAQEALGHTSLTTTQNYFAGFSTQVKKDVADKLLDFSK